MYILKGSKVFMESIDLQSASQLLLEKEAFFVQRQIPIELNWPSVAFQAFLPIYMEQLEIGSHLEGYGPWIIRKHKTEQIVGEMYIKKVRENGWDEFDLGYHIIETYRNNGYATEAVSLVTEWAFQHQIKKITAYCERLNVASQHVLIKNNFYEIGVDEEFIYFEKLLEKK
ncbi:GNAT family N-acetyltransferase [Aquibacillus koreensis]|uniref:GNAT family N-acetyltransferase n=1 Tax=Aquibacillus koreensis TaxID=279446 RepID=A0A9X3WIJ2_9BACI|nr:GNAT family N-acetyltransferase [Aquibacillus koreensis]MCT2538089.1 GNAT family N-acetyltransferase [Aquibacillus koreensis]MDC3420612.1 GNAT family N-acetyltransferase [Aquibacillus koreensis]